MMRRDEAMRFFEDLRNRSQRRGRVLLVGTPHRHIDLARRRLAARRSGFGRHLGEHYSNAPTPPFREVMPDERT